MLRLAIIGIGWAGERQVQAARELGRKLTVTRVADNDPQFLHSKAGELGLSGLCTDYRDLLEDPDVDAVSICTPHTTHKAIAVAAAAAGKHILVEKPIAMTVTDATAMIEAADQHGVRLYVAESLCYTAMSHGLRALVAQRDLLGELVGASVTSGFRATNFGYPGRRAWLTRLEQGGTGTWMLHGIHTMAQLRYILGEVEDIYLRTHRASSFERADLEGTLTGTLTLTSGIQVTLIQTCEVRFTHDLGGYAIYGDKVAIRATARGYTVYPYEQDGRPADDASPLTCVTYPDAGLSEYAQELEAFADYVAGTSAGTTDGRSERRTLAVVEAGYESLRTGQVVNIRQRFGDL